jgi:hypothetical protein
VWPDDGAHGGVQVLYTGPMFQVYNTVLRRFPKAAYEGFERGGNRSAP